MLIVMKLVVMMTLVYIICVGDGDGDGCGCGDGDDGCDEDDASPHYGHHPAQR